MQDVVTKTTRTAMPYGKYAMKKKAKSYKRKKK